MRSLIIGGPLDGQIREFAADTVIVPVRTQIDCSWLRDGPVSRLAYDLMTYEKRRLVLDVYVPLGTTAERAVELLSLGYCGVNQCSRPLRS